MKRPFPPILIAACALALVAIGLMIWSLLVPTPLPVMVAMSVAQGLGTLSLLAYLSVIIRELRSAARGHRTFAANGESGPPASRNPPK